MVTVLVERQQREAAQRKERLHAARQAAAALSVQHARSYRAQKHKQTEEVRSDAMQRWQAAQAAEMSALDALVRRGAAQQHDGNEAAAQCEADTQRTACAEAAAWGAEHTLEAARHRLAVAHTRVEAHERQRPDILAQQRRAAVRTAEKARAARVAAKPTAVPSPVEVLRRLRAAPAATDVYAAPIPVSTPVGDLVGDADEHGEADGGGGRASPTLRRWRMSSAAPHAKVTMHPSRSVSAGHSGDEGSGTEGISAAQRATQAYAEHCAAQQAAQEQARVEGQQRAAQRAAAALRQRHDAEAEAEAARRSQRERQAAVRELYRNPREETLEVPVEGEDGDALAALAPLPLQPAPMRGLTRQQQAESVYREGEADFRATFVEGPPVAVAALPPSPRTAELTALLRPADVADLLYATAETTWAPRVLPSAPLHLVSLHQAAAAAAAAAPPQAAAAPVVPQHEDHRAASPLRTVAAPFADAAFVAPAQPPNTAPPYNEDAPEVIALSPLKPPTPVPVKKQADSVIASSVAQQQQQNQQQPVRMSPVAPVEAPAPAKDLAVVMAVSQQSSSAVVSAATTPVRTPARPLPPTASPSPSSVASSSSSPYTTSRSSGSADESPLDARSEQASSLVESSRLSASTASSSTRHPLPTMTAEQLKLALLRLRSRIATAQV